MIPDGAPYAIYLKHTPQISPLPAAVGDIGAAVGDSKPPAQRAAAIDDPHLSFLRFTPSPYYQGPRWAIRVDRPAVARQLRAISRNSPRLIIRALADRRDARARIGMRAGCAARSFFQFLVGPGENEKVDGVISSVLVHGNGSCPRTVPFLPVLL